MLGHKAEGKGKAIPNTAGKTSMEFEFPCFLPAILWMWQRETEETGKIIMACTPLQRD